MPVDCKQSDNAKPEGGTNQKSLIFLARMRMQNKGGKKLNNPESEIPKSEIGRAITLRERRERPIRNPFPCETANA
ncbi:hypothetical protein L484_007640 [Morus notabilis]|uniref:Uncharacterized protein n=1 Tax=Morus notabilis TaxID=981085 RepID=W9QW27_9ROSA|nr:hypothetical protein L484_007640 [Morus notabilis]